MSIVAEFLTDFGIVLLSGVTVLLSVAAFWSWRSRSPIRQQRICEMGVAASLLWLVLASMPLPRIEWSNDVPPMPDVVVNDTATNDTISAIDKPVETNTRETLVEREKLDLDKSIDWKPHSDQASTAKPLPVSTTKSATGSGELLAHLFLVGSGLCVGWLVMGRCVLTMIVLRSTKPTSELQAIFAELPFTKRRRPRLFVSKCSRAFVFGVFRPTIIVPEGLCAPDQAEHLRHVLLHELAHVEQRDAIGRFVFNLALPLFYFHPIYWWLRRCDNLAAELVADQRAVDHACKNEYASSLIKLARTHQRPSMMLEVAGVAGSRSQLFRRMKSLIERNRRLATRTGLAWKGICTALFSLAALIGALIWGVEVAQPAAANDRTKQLRESLDRSPATVLGKRRLSSAEILPSSTIAYYSIDMHTFRERWRDSKLPDLAKKLPKHSVWQHLSDWFYAPIENRLARLGLKRKDLTKISDRELSIAIVSTGPMTKPAVVVIADVDGNLVRAEQFLDKLSKRLLDKHSTKEIRGRHDVPYTLLDKIYFEGVKRDGRICFSIHNNQLLMSDNPRVLELLIDQIERQNGRPLSEHKPFVESMREVDLKFARTNPEVRWFIKPLDFLQFSLQRGEKRVQWIDALANVGFLATRGVGGGATMERNGQLVQHVKIYAPGTNGADRAPDFDQSARMLDFPSGDLQPHEWVPSGVYGHLALNWKTREAFFYSKSLINELVGGGDPIFDEVLKSIELDPAGPQIDVPNELIRHFGERTTLLFHHRAPREVEGNLWIWAVELNDEAAVRATVNRGMDHEPFAKKLKAGEHIVWGMFDSDDEVDIPTIDGELGGVPGLGPLELEDEELDEELLWTGAVAVAHGHLFIASHPDFLVGLLDEPKDRRPLTSTLDFQQIAAQLRDKDETPASWQWFARTHFGPGGIVVRAKQDGWLVSSCVVGKTK